MDSNENLATCIITIFLKLKEETQTTVKLNHLHCFLHVLQSKLNITQKITIQDFVL
jgi:hypothetical protein